ncbi:MAG: cyclic pyranopterin monophosphate synthase MoaC [Bacillota bacterium]
MERLTHIDNFGRAHMVDVSEKADTVRIAVARGEVRMKPDTLALIKKGAMAKGDVLAVSQVAAVMGAKKTPELIPMCHPLLLTGIDVSFHINEGESKVEIEAVVKLAGKTGVEMEALNAVSVGLLTIYDMCKAVDKGMIISNIRLVSKSGGKSGEFQREGELAWEK